MANHYSAQVTSLVSDSQDLLTQKAINWDYNPTLPPAVQEAVCPLGAAKYFKSQLNASYKTP